MEPRTARLLICAYSWLALLAAVLLAIYGFTNLLLGSPLEWIAGAGHLVLAGLLAGLSVALWRRRGWARRTVPIAAIISGIVALWWLATRIVPREHMALLMLAQAAGLAFAIAFAAFSWWFFLTSAAGERAFRGEGS